MVAWANYAKRKLVSAVAAVKTARARAQLIAAAGWCEAQPIFSFHIFLPPTNQFLTQL